ncbi:hypothetical protein BN6_56370 [Saccharothrix espanaensis DSM 44229]|uniref:Cation-transporting P-type ATPase N-terminal domain-containing protein n=1 Tax=Saccharothrix espanaensis (strain ATCC 51144 / DSM 44229 / JCM 9112 / NBRC 15066 / NRRL 15764) TaxID=1179773 RepID=K0K3J0_SACES|nr:hypothetical protein BN6_56370 [Saccharothrix espanaensis DSM 44229]
MHEVVRRAGTDEAAGLTGAVAADRPAALGPNTLHKRVR